MPHFTCVDLYGYFSYFFAQCTFVSSEERQRLAREKLEKEVTHLTFESRRLELQVEELDRRKAGLLRFGRVKEAKDVVRDKHKTLKKLGKVKEILNFTEGMLEQITNTTVLKHTMTTLNEAQNLYLSMDVGTLNRRFNKLADKLERVQDQMSETQEIVSSLTPGLGADDEELLRELEECTPEAGAAAASAHASRPEQEPPPVQRIEPVMNAYRMEGLIP